MTEESILDAKIPFNDYKHVKTISKHLSECPMVLGMPSHQNNETVLKNVRFC